jgi:hypothetical protein
MKSPAAKAVGLFLSNLVLPMTATPMAATAAGMSTTATA